MNMAVRLLYNWLLPLFLLLAAPAWLLRMARRGGLDARLLQRLGMFQRPAEFESVGAIYVHAVSVGEVRMALRLIAEWLKRHPEERFVIAATTSTGFQLAETEAPDGVRVIYSPLDLSLIIRHIFNRFEPVLIVLIDSELWPNLLHLANRRGIPTALVNARLSPRSARRYERFRVITAPLLGQLKLVCAQVAEHAERWSNVGVLPEALVVTGSLKFDLEGLESPVKRDEFQEMIDAFGSGRPVILAASSHAGEERLIAEAVGQIPGGLAVILPRHAERRRTIRADLEAAGFEVVLRSSFKPPGKLEKAVLVVDSTGELRDWTAHADVVVIGKSFLSRGGQNPVEAIAVGTPVVCGPHMENFEPLITELRTGSAVESVSESDLPKGLRAVLESAQHRRTLTTSATAVLEQHRGATARIILHLRNLLERA